MDYEVPEDLKYTENHEWYDPQSGWMGITDYAQEQLGDVVFVELPATDEPVEAGQDFMVVESMKTVSDVYAPVDGKVVELNEELESAPEAVNDAPYEAGRLVRLEAEDGEAELLSAGVYLDFLETED